MAFFYYGSEGNAFNIENLAKELSANNTFNPGMFEIPKRKCNGKFEFDHQQAGERFLWLGTIEELAAFFRELFEKNYVKEVNDQFLTDVLLGKFAFTEKEKNKIKTNKTGKPGPENSNDLSKKVKYNLPLSSKIE